MCTVKVLSFVCKFAALVAAANGLLAITKVVLLTVFKTCRLERGSPIFGVGLFEGGGFASSGVTTLYDCLTVVIIAAVLGCRFRCMEK